MENPFAEKLASLKRPNYGKLSFGEQCAFYAALKCDVPPIAVAKVAGVSQATVSLLSGAGEMRGGQMRYPKVAREYDSLGHDAFVHSYLNPIIRDRLMVEMDKITHAARNPDVNSAGFNPRANRYGGRHEWALSYRLTVFRIELHADRGGYFWRDLKPYSDMPEIPAEQIAFNPDCPIVGDPSRGPERGPDAKGFPTSELCYRACKRLFNPTGEPIMSRTGPPRDYRIGMVEPNKGSHSPPKAPLLTRQTRARAENEARNRAWEREYEQKQDAERQRQEAERRARVEAEVQRMLEESSKKIPNNIPNLHPLALHSIITIL